MATSRTALCAPVWPSDMILVSMIEEITGCFEEIQGFNIGLFADRERNRGEVNTFGEIFFEKMNS